jgi:DNA-binding response OmpR family regulator
MKASPCILVVDNDVFIREFIVTALADEGFEALTAPSSQTALAQLSSTRPYLLLMDINHISPDDLTLITEYRDLLGNEATVAIMTTASHPDYMAARVEADAFLSKPFNLNDLFDIVTRYRNHSSVSANTVG